MDLKICLLTLNKHFRKGQILSHLHSTIISKALKYGIKLSFQLSFMLLITRISCNDYSY